MSEFYRRLFLNKPKHHAGAYVIAHVQSRVHRDKKTKKITWRTLTAELTIADCRRVVELDFCASGHDAKQYERELKNVLYKAHTLLHVVNDFVAAIETAIEEIEQQS